MYISGSGLVEQMAAFMLPLFRIVALFMVAPVFSGSQIPHRTRLGLAMVVVFIVAPVSTLSVQEGVQNASLALAVMFELLVGLLMGFTLKLAFSALEVAGSVIATQMGLGFAAINDPGNGAQIPVVSHLYLVLATLLFLVHDGHLLLIELVARSFQDLPSGGFVVGPESLWKLVTWGSQMFAGAVSVALPAIASLLVVNLAFGVMTRAAPQLNIFAVGFPITLLLGLLVILYGLPAFAPQFSKLLAASFAAADAILPGAP